MYVHVGHVMQHISMHDIWHYSWYLGSVRPTSFPGVTMLCVNNADENEWITSKLEDWYYMGYTDRQLR